VAPPVFGKEDGMQKILHDYHDIVSIFYLILARGNYSVYQRPEQKSLIRMILDEK